MTARALTAGSGMIGVGGAAAATYATAPGPGGAARGGAAGARIIDVGEPAAALYWIAHGTVAVTRAASPAASPERPEDWTVLGELHSGAFFGEIALVGGTRQTARITAVDD